MRTLDKNSEMKSKYVAAIFTILVTFVVHASSSEKISGQTSANGITITFKGPISRGDASMVEAVYIATLREAKIRQPIVDLQSTTLVINSTGGSVDEAIAMGKWIREKQGAVIVPFDANCFSSCVYVLAGGSRRQPFGNVGIHRPYLAQETSGSYSKLMQGVLTRSRDYFLEMGIPEKLADAMFAVEPEENKVLNRSQLAEYRLNQMDVGLKEEAALTEAKRLGISRTEYNARRSRFLKDHEVCSLMRPIERMQACIEESLTKNGLR